MKKLVSLLVLGGLALALSGCSGSESTPKPPADGAPKPSSAPGDPKDGV